MLVEKKHYENNQKKPTILPIANLFSGILGLLNRKPKEPQVPNKLTEMSDLQRLENQKNAFLDYTNFAQEHGDEKSLRIYKGCVKDLNAEIQQLNEQVDR